MRIKLAGAYLLYEFQDAVDCIVQSLQANGVTELRSVNLYLTPFSDNTELAFEDQECGQPFDMMTYAGQRRRAFESISPRLGPQREAGPVGSPVITWAPSRTPGALADFFGLLAERASAPSSPAQSSRRAAAGTRARK